MACSKPLDEVGSGAVCRCNAITFCHSMDLLPVQTPLKLGSFEFYFKCGIGERGGSLCWQCWSQREAFGLQQDCRNARKCTVLQNSDLERLISAVSMSRASKRAKLED